MSICLRIDLDYVPWDSTGDSSEPVILLKLLDFARRTGTKFHYFISARSLRAFPTSADAILGEGHDLDWLTDDTTQQHVEQALSLFKLAGHKIIGIATHNPSIEYPAHLDCLQFISGPEELRYEMVPIFPAHALDLRAAVFSAPLRETSDRDDEHTTLIISPSQLTVAGPNLSALDKFVEDLSSRSIPIRTIRDWLKT